MAKTATPAPKDKTVNVNEAAIRSDMQALDNPNGLAELTELASSIGAIQMADLTTKFLRAAEIRLFERVRESNQIKHLPIRTPDGLRTAETLVEFCPLVFGRSYSVMAEEQQNLDVLGEQSYEAASRLGLNRNALRAARALPPEKLETVRLAIANGGSKAEVLSVIEDLAVKVEQATKAAEEAQAEKAATDELVTKKNQKIDTLTKQLKKIEKLPADDALTELKKEATACAADAEGAVLGSLRQALLVLSNHGDERGLNAVFMAGLVGQVQARLTELREEFNLPDVSSAAEQQLAAEAGQWFKK